MVLEDYAKVSGRIVALNAISNYGRYVIEAVIMFFLQAFIVRSLGKEEYSYWPLIRSVLSFLGILSVGIGGGTARYLAFYVGKGDEQQIKKIITSMGVVLGIIGMVYISMSFLISINAFKFLTIETPYRKKVIIALFLVGISNGIKIPFSIFNGILRSIQKYTTLNFIQITIQFLRFALIVSLFKLMQPSLVILSLVTLTVTCVDSVVELMVAKKYLGFTGFEPLKYFDFNSIKNIAGFSFFLLVSYIAGRLYWETDNILINKLLVPSMVTGYSVATSFVLQFYTITTLGVRVLMPTMTILRAKNQISRIIDMAVKINKVVIPLAGFLLIFFAIWGSDFLSLYIGNEYRMYGKIFLILGIPELISATQAVSGIIPQAYGNMKTVSIMSLAVAILNVILSIVFVKIFNMGVEGIALGTAVVMIFHKLFFWPWYIGKLTGIEFKSYFYKSIIIPTATLFPVTIAMLITSALFDGIHGWLEMLTLISIFGMLSTASVFFLSLDQMEREKVKIWIKKPKF